MAQERVFTDVLGNWKRSVYCGEPRADSVGRELILAGWVQSRRDHGGVIFVDLRDRTGIVQVGFNKTANLLASSEGNGCAGDCRVCQARIGACNQIENGFAEVG